MAANTDIKTTAPNLLKMLLVPKGRINKQQFFVCLGMFLIISYLFLGLGDRPQDRGLFFWISNIYLTYSIYGKRLHDRSRSARDVVVMLLISFVGLGVIAPYFAAQAVRAAFSGGSAGGAGAMASFTTIGVFGMWIVMTFRIGFPVGHPAVNEYGPPPHSDMFGRPGGTFDGDTAAAPVPPPVPREVRDDGEVA